MPPNTRALASPGDADADADAHDADAHDADLARV